MLPFLAFLALSVFTSGASNIYDAIGRFYNWSEMPQDDTGVFFGFAGCTRKVLIYAIECMRNTFASGWYTSDFFTRSTQLKALAQQIANETGASAEGLYKWCSRVYSACTKDSDILGYMAGGDFSKIDYYKKVVSENVSEAAQQAAETVEYGINYESHAEKKFSAVLPVVGILGACYIVKKVLD